MRFEEVVLVPVWPDEVVDVGRAQRWTQYPRGCAVVVLDCARVGAHGERTIGESASDSAADLFALHREHVLACFVDLLLVLHGAPVEHGVEVLVRLLHGFVQKVIFRQRRRQGGEPTDGLHILLRDRYRRDSREAPPHGLGDRRVRV